MYNPYSTIAEDYNQTIAIIRQDLWECRIIQDSEAPATNDPVNLSRKTIQKLMHFQLIIVRI